MKPVVRRIAEQVKALPENELDEFLSSLTQYETGPLDKWDKEIERDSQDGGRLRPIWKQARDDIAAGRTKPLEEVIGEERSFTRGAGK